MERGKIESFEDLLVWQKGIALVKQVYLLTADGPLNKDFGLRDHLKERRFQFQQTSQKVSNVIPERNICSS